MRQRELSTDQSRLNVRIKTATAQLSNRSIKWVTMIRLKTSSLKDCLTAITGFSRS
jgi:hypothetical protein